ncbi:alpha/beta hydrolase [Nesterenkonia ebinurensis]|uniref:alpha/beta hydrolase n=1 Tax=Nesterenkonia ebinurensis TaxID=2608252 RepID=UPI00168AD45C|nr:alpha/beta hydrolase [Nesterenkonia ebinurensis]
MAAPSQAADQVDPEPEVETITDLAYTDPVPAETQGNLLDLYLPVSEDEAPLPLIIWTSGSAWMGDTGKEGAGNIAEEFTSRGFAVAGVSVRSSSQVQFPGQLHDIRASIRWLRANADEYNIDPDRIAIMGDSSGGWVAAIAATTSSIDQLGDEPDTEGVSSAVQASVPFFPPVDLLLLDEQTAEQHEAYDLPFDPFIVHDDPQSPESMLIGCPIQECPEETERANPVAYVDGTEPPIHVFHGTHDPLLPPGSSETLFNALVNVGSSATYTLVEEAGHSVVEIIGAENYTVYQPNPSGELVTGQDPAPTWDNIEQFLWDSLGTTEPGEPDPSPTETPSPTPTEPTEEPSPTESPAPTEEPSETETPAPTEEPSPTPSESPSETEEPTETSSPDPSAVEDPSKTPAEGSDQESDLAATGAQTAALVTGSALLILIGVVTLIWFRKHKV